MPVLDSCINALFEPGHIGASSGTPPVIIYKTSLYPPGMYVLEAEAGLYALIGSTVNLTKGTAPPPPTSPPGVTGMLGWWDASVTASLSLTGSDINSVADQSGGSNNLTWYFAKPTYSATGLGGYPAINMAGGKALTKTSFPMGTGNTLTWFFVGRLGLSSSSSSGRYLSYASTSNANDYDDVQSWMVFRASSTTQMTFYRNATSTAKTTTAHPAVHRFIGTVNSSGVMTLYIDNVASTTATLAGNWSSLGTFIVGSNLSTEFIDTDFGEIGVATGYSDATAVGLLDAYLKTKWGL